MAVRRDQAGASLPGWAFEDRRASDLPASRNIAGRYSGGTERV